MRRLKNIIKSIIWYVTSMPIGVIASVLLIIASLIEAIVRLGDSAWNPWNPFHDHALPPPSDAMPPKLVMGDADEEFEKEFWES